MAELPGGARSAADGTILLPSPALSIVAWPERLELPMLNGEQIGRFALQLLAVYGRGRFTTIDAACAALPPGIDPQRFRELSLRLLWGGGLISVPLDPTRPPVQPDRSHAALRSTGPTLTDPEARSDPPSDAVALETPLSIQARDGGFRVVGHQGEPVVSLSVEEVLALPDLAPAGGFPPGDPPRPSGSALDDGALATLCHRLHVAGLLTARASRVPGRTSSPGHDADLVRQAFAAAAEREAVAEAERRARTGVARTPVVPVSFTNGPPLALGLIVAHCSAHEGGRLGLRYEFRRDWEWDDARLAHHTAQPAVFMCSAYVWSHVKVLDVVRAVKAASPESLVVMGGPDVPKRAGDAERYMGDHPEVDVIVRGEGEQTALEMLDAISVDVRGAIDASRLVDVPGLTVRTALGIVRTPDRERMTDLNVVPSPFLTGLFDTYREAPLPQVILETNRGCPYGCTFCDWGSATQSRIRQFDLDRVFGEIEWAASAQVRSLSFADANFGIFARDVDIAKHVVECRTALSHPIGMGANFAKNTVKHLGPIIRTLVEGGIVNRGLLALQSTDEATLDAVERSNIKVERYDAIAAEMRSSDLPFAVELMMGLPGSTPSSFKADLQQCIDREVEGTVNPTTVLVNSPMNSPEYRNRHAIETAVDISPGAHALVVATATFSREDYQAMNRLRRTFLLAENFGAIRHVDRLVRHETGVVEIDFLDQLCRDVLDDAHGRRRHPFLRHLFGQRHHALVTPVSWRLLLDDLEAYVRRRHPAVDAGSLATALRVQHALLPAVDRRFPVEVSLDHDYVAWFSLVVAAKERGHLDDWPDHVPPLRSFGPGILLVDDPGHSARNNLGCSVDHGPLLASWEHSSAVSRALYHSARATESAHVPERGS